MCNGYPLQFPSGTSAHTQYLFALHRILSLPWNYTVRSGVMTLHIQSCTKFVGQDECSCQNCCELQKNTRLQEILARFDEGIKKYSPFAYYGFDKLCDLLHHKNVQIEFYRLCGLNQVCKLLEKETKVSEYKRFVITLSSGKVERVDQVI
jgi:hypothetical protein